MDKTQIALMIIYIMLHSIYVHDAISVKSPHFFYLLCVKYECILLKMIKSFHCLVVFWVCLVFWFFFLVFYDPLKNEHITAIWYGYGRLWSPRSKCLKEARWSRPFNVIHGQHPSVIVKFHEHVYKERS